MNSFINILTLVLTFPLLALAVYSGFDIPIDSLGMTGSEIPYQEEIASPSIPTIQELGFVFQPTDTRAAFQGKGGEQNALDRLQQYFWEKDLLRSYKETRNELVGINYSTKFSAWLANGSLSPRIATLAGPGTTRAMAATRNRGTSRSTAPRTSRRGS